MVGLTSRTTCLGGPHAPNGMDVDSWPGLAVVAAGRGVGGFTEVADVSQGCWDKGTQAQSEPQMPMRRPVLTSRPLPSMLTALPRHHGPHRLISGEAGLAPGAGGPACLGTGATVLELLPAGGFGSAGEGEPEKSHAYPAPQEPRVGPILRAQGAGTEALTARGGRGLPGARTMEKESDGCR